MKVMTIVGTRPEIIKLSRVIAELDRRTHHVLVHTGQNHDYELNQIFFDGLGIRSPDHYLDASGENAAQTISQVISRADTVLAHESPDAVLLLGDTNSCLAAISAKRRKIPIFHMEAGNRCFDQRVPEEINRRLVDHLSDINLVYTEHARRYLLTEGVRPDLLMKTGSPMREVLMHYLPAIEDSPILAQLGLSRREFFVVSAHREENIDSEANFLRLIATLREVATRYAMPIIVSTHPRTRARIERHGAIELPALVRLLKPLGLADYVKLQTNALCVVSDSGTLTEESSILGFPGVMIREAHERPEGMDEAAVVMSGLDLQRVIEAIDLAVAHYPAGAKPFAAVPDYAAGNVSQKVVRIIISYTDYVNRVVWRK